MRLIGDDACRAVIRYFVSKECPIKITSNACTFRTAFHKGRFYVDAKGPMFSFALELMDCGDVTCADEGLRNLVYMYMESEREAHTEEWRDLPAAVIERLFRHFMLENIENDRISWNALTLEVPQLYRNSSLIDGVLHFSPRPDERMIRI